MYFSHKSNTDPFISRLQDSQGKIAVIHWYKYKSTPENAG